MEIFLEGLLEIIFTHKMLIKQEKRHSWVILCN
uniref:Uncharacterized protein n=1 Tax=Rhizophora mucronata TaxID=61149 RepID=A0A2P2QWK1_RHIMU